MHTGQAEMFAFLFWLRKLATQFVYYRLLDLNVVSHILELSHRALLFFTTVYDIWSLWKHSWLFYT